MPHSARNPRVAAARAHIALLVILVVLLAGWAFARSAEPNLRPIGTAADIPASPALHNGAWYWLDAPPGKPKSLVRADSESKPIADSVTAFDVSDSGLYWIQKEDSDWHIKTDSARSKTLWQSKDEPYSVKVFGENLYFLTRVPGADPSSPLPALADSLALWSMSAQGGPTHKIAQFMESEAGAILPNGPDSLLLTALRPGMPGATAFYEVSIDSGSSRRLFGAEGRGSVARAPDGTVYWMGPSHESSEFLVDTSVNRRTPKGRIETLLEWMPPGGSLFESGGDVYCIDGSMEASIWPARASDSLPRPIRIPRGFGGAAISNGKALLFKRVPSGLALTEMDLR